MRVKKDEAKLHETESKKCPSSKNYPSLLREGSLISGDIKILKEHLFKENKGKLILWLQKIVVEACFVKLMLTNSDVLKDTKHVMEPSVYYYTRKLNLI